MINGLFAQCETFDADQIIGTGALFIDEYSVDYVLESQDELGYYVTNTCPNSEEGRIMLYFYNNAQELRTLNVSISFYDEMYAIDIQSVNDMLQNVSVNQSMDANNFLLTTVTGTLDFTSNDDCKRMYIKIKPQESITNSGNLAEQFLNITTNLEYADLPGLAADIFLDFEVSDYYKQYKTLKDIDGDGHVYFSDYGVSPANPQTFSFYIEEGVTLHADLPETAQYDFYNFKFGNGAAFQIDDGNLLFQQGAIIDGCENMWKGIELINGRLIFRDSEIHDAEVGFNYSQQAAVNNFALELSGTELINNRIGFKSELINENISTALQGFQSNIFKGVGVLKPMSDGSYSGDRPFTGIYISGSDYLNYFKVSEFENMENGIIVKSSSGTLWNHEFRNIDTGIEVSSINGGNSAKVVSVIRNEFENMGTAISIKHHGLIVRDNHKIEASTGILAYNMTDKVFRVYDNDNILTTKHGIDLNIGNRGQVYDNTITMTGNQPNAVALKYDFMSYHNTFGNTINSGSNDAGMLLRNCWQSNRTSENTLTSSATNDYAAIKLQGSTRNFLSCNDLRGAGVDGSLTQASASQGFYSSMSPVNFIECNTLREFDQGYLFIGNNDLSSIKGNILGNHFVGMQLGSDMSTNFQNGIIGPQEHAGNAWEGSYTDLGLRSYAPFTAVGLSQFIIDPNDDADFLPTFSPTDLVENQGSNGNFFACTSTNSCMGNPGVGIIPNFIPTDKFSPWIGGDGVLQDPNVSVNEGWIWQTDILDAIWTYVDPNNTTPWMDDFLDDMQGTDSEQLLMVMDLIEEANEPNAAIESINDNIVAEITNLNNLQSTGGSQTDIDASLAQLDIYYSSVLPLLAAEDVADDILYHQANQLLSTVITTNDVSAAYKSALGIYIHYLQSDNLTSLQLTQLSTLANNCVTEYGKSVYISRGLLSMKQGYISYDDYDLCNYTVPRSNERDTDIENISFYPNPTAKDLIVESPIPLVSYTIYDIQGKRILTNDFNSDSIDVSLLKSGIYILEAIDKNGTMNKLKFIKQ